MFTTKFKAFLKEEDGATAIEYGLIAALVSVAAIGALNLMGESLTSIFTVVQEALTNASGTAEDAGAGAGGEGDAGDGG